LKVCSARDPLAKTDGSIQGERALGGISKPSGGEIGGFPAVEGSTRGIPPVDRSPPEGCCFCKPHSGVSGSVARLETGPSLGVVAKDRSVVKL
jgi:hypothetical protein